MKRSILFTFCMIFLLGVTTYSPNPTLDLDENNVTVSVYSNVPSGTQHDDSASEIYIVDKIYDTPDEWDQVYNVWGQASSWSTSVSLHIVPTIEITLPQRMYISDLKYKFAFKVNAWHQRCWGFTIKADEDILFYDKCAPYPEEGQNVGGGWQKKEFNLSVPVNREVSKITVELEAFAESHKPFDNTVHIEFQVYEIEPIEPPPPPPDTTDPVITIPDLQGSTQPIEVEVPVRDTESGLREVNLNCKFYYFNIQSSSPAEFHSYVEAFTPGTTDTVKVFLKANRIPPSTTFTCGIYAKDMAGNDVYVEKGFTVPRATP